MLCHALGHEFEPRWWQFFLDPSTISTLSSWFYLVYLIWYYYLSVKFAMWIVKQKIENKQTFLKNLVTLKWMYSDSTEFQSAWLNYAESPHPHSLYYLLTDWLAPASAANYQVFHHKFKLRLGKLFTCVNWNYLISYLPIHRCWKLWPNQLTLLTEENGVCQWSEY